MITMAADITKRRTKELCVPYEGSAPPLGAVSIRSSSKIKTDETLMKHQDPPTPSQEYRGKECVTWSTEISNIQAMGSPPG